MIWFAVRVVNALPFDDRYAPVIAFEIAATELGATTPSRPLPVGTPRFEVTVAVAGAPAICVTVSTLPTRSTTAIVAGAPRAVASLIACKTIVLTSASVRFEVVVAVVGLTGVGEIAGGVALVAGNTLPPPPPPPPHPDGAAHSTER